MKKMGRIWAVARNTFVSAVRMKTAIVFMAMLLILLPILSYTSTGDGTAIGRVQSFVSYGLGLVSFLLSMLTIVVACYTLSSDVKHKRVYSVVTKPIRRFEFVIGKALGVILLDLLLLAVFSGVIYGLTIQMPRFAKTSDEELVRLKNEFFTARASLKRTIDEQALEKQADDVYKELVRTGQLDESRSRESVMAELRSAAKYNMYAAGPGGTVLWEFKKVRPFDANESLFIRFKFNAAQTPADKSLYGVWYVGDYRQIQGGPETMKTPIYQIPRKDVVSTMREFEVPADAVAADGYLAVGFYNEPMNGTTVIFPIEDGFEVLYKAGGFGGNFISAVLIMFARLVFLACLGVSLSTWVGFPVAILCSLTIFFTGVINGFVVQSFDYLGQNLTIFYSVTIKPLIWLLPKFDQNYNVNKYLIDARMIRYGFLALAAGVLLLKSLILLLIGFFIFAKRELAKVVI
jgi:hypothetical protein